MDAVSNMFRKGYKRVSFALSKTESSLPIKRRSLMPFSNSFNKRGNYFS